MSKTKSKGTFAETAVAEFLNQWYDYERPFPENGEGWLLKDFRAASILYPHFLRDESYEERARMDSAVMHLYARQPMPEWTPRNWKEIGYPFSRIPVGGSLDIGDVVGPFTSIEVKNHENPALAALMANAEWKAQNSGRPNWCLVWKAKGKGLQNVGAWHAAMNLDALIKLSSLPKIETVEELNELSFSTFDFTESYPNFTRPQYQWNGKLVVLLRKAGVDVFRDQYYYENTGVQEDGTNIIPFIVSARREGGIEAPVGRWYAYTKLTGFARMLETVGILPQDVSEYVLPQS